MARDNLDFLLGRPQDPLQELLSQLPPERPDDEKLEEAKKQVFSNLYTGQQPRDPSMLNAPGMEDMALKYLQDQREQAAADQQAAIKKEESDRLAKLKALQDRNKKLMAAGLTPTEMPAAPEVAPEAAPEQAPAPIRAPAAREPISTPPSLAQATQQVKTSASDLYGPGLGDKDIAAAQEANKKAQLMSMLLSSGDLIGQGLSRGNYAGTPNIGEGVAKMGKQGVEDILTRRDAKSKELEAQRKVFELASDKERNDPNSAVSQLAQDILDRMGQGMGRKFNTKGMSAASLEKVFGPIERYAAVIEAGKARKEAQEDKATTKEEEKKYKRTKDMRTEIDRKTKDIQATYNSREEIDDFLNLAIAEPGNRGFQDMAIQYGFIKSRDNTAVREGELKLLSAAGSIPDRIRRTVTRAVSGQTYDKADLQELQRLIKKEKKQVANTYFKTVSPALKQAEKEGLDKSELLRQDILADAQEEEKSPSKMVKIRRKADGVTKEVPADQAQKFLKDSAKYESVE